MESASIASSLAHEHDEHHGPPEPHQSSRVEAQFLGMLLFIISEVMLFGAFFTAYFFLRVVNHDPWPAHGTELPKLIAGFNTAILISSSFTMHWALVSIKRNSRFELIAGLALTLVMGLTFLSLQIHEYLNLGFTPSNNAFASGFFCLTGLHGFHVFVGATLLSIAFLRSAEKQPSQIYLLSLTGGEPHAITSIAKGAGSITWWGLRDRVISVRRAARTARAIPRARLLVLPRTGHVAQMERPNVVARAVLGMWEHVEAGTW